MAVATISCFWKALLVEAEQRSAELTCMVIEVSEASPLW